MPCKMPVEASVKPGGKTPPTDQLRAPEASALNCTGWKVTPTSPGGKTSGEIANGCVTVIWNWAVPDSPVLSVARMVKMKAPGAVGVPLIVPPALTLSPAGSAPPATLQE